MQKVSTFNYNLLMVLLLIVFLTIYCKSNKTKEVFVTLENEITGKYIVPDCPQWVNHAVLFQIYPQSFYDSDGDGIGDLKGIIQKLDYIKSLGADAVWINPFFESPFCDPGYDISDYYKVAPRYGTNEDAKKLFKEA